MSALDQVKTLSGFSFADPQLFQYLSVAFESQLAPRLTPISFLEQRNRGKPKGTFEATRGESKHRRATNFKDTFCQPLSSNRTKNGTERMTRSDSNSDREARLRLWLAGWLDVWLSGCGHDNGHGHGHGCGHGHGHPRLNQTKITYGRAPAGTRRFRMLFGPVSLFLVSRSLSSCSHFSRNTVESEVDLR